MAGRGDKSIGGKLSYACFFFLQQAARISYSYIAVANGFAWFSRPTASFFVSPSPGLRWGEGREGLGVPSCCS